MLRTLAEWRGIRSSCPVAFRAIMTILQPSAFLPLVKGNLGECCILQEMVYDRRLTPE